MKAVRHFVYILQSTVDGTFYKGYTTNPRKRLDSHNNGESKYTSGKIPWELIYVEEHQDKKSALIRERKLKRTNSRYIRWLIKQNSNILNR